VKIRGESVRSRAFREKETGPATSRERKRRSWATVITQGKRYRYTDDVRRDGGGEPPYHAPAPTGKKKSKRDLARQRKKVKRRLPQRRGSG